MNHDLIRDMLHQNAMELFGQPKWTFGKNTCNTYEVFVEKIHLANGEVMPAWPVMEIIASDNALSRDFSKWYLDAAIKSATELTEAANANVTLTAKLLPAFANTPTFIEDVMAILERYGMRPGKLQFELSEAQNLSERGIEALNLLHDEHGIGLWMDNFGTGHANLDLLREVHFDGVELHRSYAGMIPDHEQTCRLVVAIQHMALTMDLQLCAKGIETQEQFEFFEELSFYKGQGFLIGMPMDMKSMEDYIRKYAVPRGHA